MEIKLEIACVISHLICSDLPGDGWVAVSRGWNLITRMYQVITSTICYHRRIVPGYATQFLTLSSSVNGWGFIVIQVDLVQLPAVHCA